MPALALLLLACLVTASEVPPWILKGILSVESSSRYNADGTIEYVNRAKGKAGERGPFQVLPSTFRLYAKSGERIERLETDMVFAESFTKRILSDLYAKHQSWILVLSCYNRGHVCQAGKKYGHRVAFIGHNL